MFKVYMLMSLDKRNHSYVGYTDKLSKTFGKKISPS